MSKSNYRRVSYVGCRGGGRKRAHGRPQQHIIRSDKAVQTGDGTIATQELDAIQSAEVYGPGNQKIGTRNEAVGKVRRTE
jgi:hypothetical protein